MDNQINGPMNSKINLIRLRNERDMQCTIATYGAAVTELRVPDRSGNLQNVVLSFPTIKEYKEARGHFGATVGRYANRIAGGRFNLDGKEYQLNKNSGNNTLHGGLIGFDKRLWQVESSTDKTVSLSYLSPDMEEGFPGNLTVHVNYTLTDDNALEIEYRATTDKATPINLTHHAYFNLNGHPSQILNHYLWVDADAIVEVDSELRPTGKLKSITDSPLDFRSRTQLSQRVNSMCQGLDHNFCLNSPSMEHLSVSLHSPITDISLVMSTNQPGVQIYTCNGTKPEETCGRFDQYYGITLESQTYPDGVNQPNFPNSILRPGETYIHNVRYQFGIPIALG